MALQDWETCALIIGAPPVRWSGCCSWRYRRAKVED